MNEGRYPRSVGKTTSARERSAAAAANRAVYWLSRHWLIVASMAWGLYVGLPWLAPVFMELGWTGAGNAVYLIYSTQCHQLPQRSFFLFGARPMYSLAEIQAAWQNTNNPAILRQFVGNPEMGWKVAWSDRMVSMYTATLLAGLLYWALNKRLRPLPIRAFALLILPIVADGGSHMISDFAGIGQGFRDGNDWLAVLTNNALPPAFYAGDTLGSFNSWMRLITGVLFGIGVVWLVYPHAEEVFADAAARIREKFQRARLPL